MTIVKPLTSHFLIDGLTAVSEAGGVPVKYPKAADYPLSRSDCAEICQKLLHLPDKFREVPDVLPQDKYSGAIGAALDAGLMELIDGRFQGHLPLERRDAETVLQAAGRFLNERRRGFRPFKATALQFNPRMYEKESNISRLYTEAEKAFANGARLVVAPETCTSAYVYFDREEIAPYVETIPGPATELFAQLTKKYRGYISFGIAEVDPATGDFYNSAALIGPEGYIGKYRKIHQWETEKHWSVDGDLGVPVFSTELGNLAMIICIDASYYEAARLAAVNGADIILYLTCDSGEAIWSLPSRALQNGVYIVSANRFGSEKDFTMVGASSIWDPDGHKLAEGELVLPGQAAQEETQHVSAIIDPAKYDNPGKRRLFERKPALYRELRLHISPWDKRKSTVGREVNALALQYEPALGDREANQEKLLQLIGDAWEKNRTINLMVLPELPLTGPIAGDASLAEQAAEELEGKSFRFFSAIAGKYRSALVFTMIERADGRLYHTAVVLESDGSLLGAYRKIHLNARERLWATAGSKVQTFMSGTVGRIGVIIGDEYFFPEICGLLQIKRADFIAMPQAYAGGGGAIEANPRIVARAYPENAVLLWDSIAVGSQAYLVAANYVGTSSGYVGGSGLYSLEPIYGKDQPLLAGREETGFVVRFQTLAAEKWWLDQEKKIASRHPAHYIPLIV